MEILDAYCQELGRVVDIYEAQEAFFALPMTHRRRFTFGCSDDACRAKRSPLVSGINYDKLAEKDQKFRQPHFRAPAGHLHLETCAWVQSATQKLGASGDACGTDDQSTRLEHAKATNIIDVFRPKGTDPVVDNVTTSATPATVSVEEAAVKHGSPGTQNTRDGKSTTSRLVRFVDCWLQLEEDAQKLHQIEIDGKVLTYRQAVLRPNRMNPQESGSRIVYGGARIKFWPAQNPTRIYINFMDECERFAEHGESRSLTIDLAIARIQSYRGGALLLQRIECAKQPGHYIKVFCWGPIVPRKNKSGYEVALASLDNFAFKVVAPSSSS